MVHENDSQGQQPRNDLNTASNEADTRNNRNKVLGDVGRNGGDQGDSTPKRRKKIEILNEEIKVSENGNEISITLQRTERRNYKLGICLNGNPIVPMSFAGQGQARCYWELLKTQLKGNEEDESEGES